MHSWQLGMLPVVAAATPRPHLARVARAVAAAAAAAAAVDDRRANQVATRSCSGVLPVKGYVALVYQVVDSAAVVRTSLCFTRKPL